MNAPGQPAPFFCTFLCGACQSRTYQTAQQSGPGLSEAPALKRRCLPTALAPLGRSLYAPARGWWRPAPPLASQQRPRGPIGVRFLRHLEPLRPPQPGALGCRVRYSSLSSLLCVSPARVSRGGWERAGKLRRELLERNVLEVAGRCGVLPAIGFYIAPA